MPLIFSTAFKQRSTLLSLGFLLAPTLKIKQETRKLGKLVSATISFFLRCKIILNWS